MKKYITMLVGMVMAFCFYGCSDDVPSNPYKEYDLPIDCKGLNIEMGKAILIQNESDFNALFSSYQNLPPVDFDQSTLLLVKGESPNGIQSRAKDVQTDNGRVHVNIIIFKNYTCVMEKWVLGYILPKVKEEQIKLDINYQF